MPMTKNKQTDEQLQEASNHLHYEFWMLMSMAEALSSGIAEKGWLANALLESFLIHFRAICDFFYPNNTQSDDVLAEHFVSNSNEWNSKTRPPLSKNLEDARKRAHKELAHITYTRNTVISDKKSWPVMEIVYELKELMKIFQENALKNRLSSKWNAFENKN